MSKKPTLEVAMVQTNLVWEHPEKNRAQLTAKISQLSTAVDLIVLPEMFTSGFTMQAHLVAETMLGSTVQWMHKMAQQKAAALVGSLVIQEGGLYHNRLVFVTPEGELSYYDKRHAFSLVNEGETYTAGTKKLVVNYKGWRICPLICYDLRFPVWSRNVENYDVLLYVANWPVPRIQAWDALLQARAIENMSYCIGVNRVGKDGVGAQYNGSTACYDVLGRPLAKLPLNEDTSAIVTLHKSHITKLRHAFNFLNDKDAFSLLK